MCVSCSALLCRSLSFRLTRLPFSLSNISTTAPVLVGLASETVPVLKSDFVVLYQKDARFWHELLTDPHPASIQTVGPVNIWHFRSHAERGSLQASHPSSPVPHLARLSIVYYSGFSNGSRFRPGQLRPGCKHSASATRRVGCYARRAKYPGH